MKQIKNRWHVLLNAILTALVSSAATSCIKDGPLALYAPPPPDPEPYVSVHGQVVNEANEPIRDVEMSFKYIDGPELGLWITSNDGEFWFEKKYEGDPNTDTLRVVASDLNNVYVKDSLTIPVSEMSIDTLEVDMYGYRCECQIQLNRNDQENNSTVNEKE